MLNMAFHCCTSHWSLGVEFLQPGGAGTIESRGTDTTVTCSRSAETCAMSVVSERAPGGQRGTRHALARAVVGADQQDVERAGGRGGAGPEVLGHVEPRDVALEPPPGHPQPEHHDQHEDAQAREQPAAPGVPGLARLVLGTLATSGVGQRGSFTLRCPPRRAGPDQAGPCAGGGRTMLRV